MKVLLHFGLGLSVIALVAALLVGCGKNAAADGKVFDSAGPEIKATWDKAQAAAQAKDYATALLTYRQLSSRTDLTPEQVKALGQASTAVSDQMYDAANKGDAEAAKAIETMRKARYR